MKIAELQPKGKVNLTAEVVDLGEVRTFNKFGKEGRVLNVTIKDESGQVTLTLWNEETDIVEKGCRVTIENGYASEYQGELQVSAGKFGSLKVENGSDDSSAQSEKTSG